MIQAWKIRREVQRLGQQLSALHQTLWEPILQRRHDRLVDCGLPVFDGNIPLRPKIALFLLYQQGVLPQSMVQTCAHLAENGYSPLIVANGGLTAESRATLLPGVWKILERPNFGYDFGGYRDGILQLHRWGLTPDRLLILNDSIWFPILPQDTLLADMEAANVDVAGTILRQKNGHGFLESYLYLMKGGVLQNPVVRRFWQSYRLTANKYKVIRRGERSHSAALMAAGYDLVPMFSSADFLQRLAAEDDVFLSHTLRFSVADSAGLAATRDALLRDDRSQNWREAAMEHIERVLQSAQFYSAFPYASVKLMRYPILKKSGDRVAVLWRKAYTAAVEAGEIDVPSISNELNAQVLREQYV